MSGFDYFVAAYAKADYRAGLECLFADCLRAATGLKLDHATLVRHATARVQQNEVDDATPRVTIVLFNYPTANYVEAFAEPEAAWRRVMGEIDEHAHDPRHACFSLVDGDECDAAQRLEAWNDYQATAGDPYLIEVHADEDVQS